MAQGCRLTAMLATKKPFSLILFGASGHLAKIKIFPALYFLALKKRLPDDFLIMGFSRTKMTDEQFRADFEKAVRKYVAAVNDEVLKKLLTHVRYHAGQYDGLKDFKSLASSLEKYEKGWKDPVRVAYLSIPPVAFRSVLKNLCEGGVHIHAKKRPDFRCIVEKPVGHDSESFSGIRSDLYSCFKPEEVFLLDHYLGKEAVRNVYYLRFANPVIERLLKNTLITHVQITAAETAGVEGRAGYFDAVGTFRDMFQSHLLQISALLTMRLLESDEAVKAARLDALQKFYLPPASDLKEIVVQGQYEKGMIGKEKVVGYTQEEDVKAKSQAGTFAAMKVMSRSSRWAGVPIFLRSGKRMAKKETRITIEFHESHCLGKGLSKNRLDIILQGEAGLKMYLQTKLGGTEPQFRPLIMEDPLVCVGDCLVEHSLLLMEAINGNQRWFLDPEEVRLCWTLVDPLQSYLEQKNTPLHVYAAGSHGPEAADELIARSGFAWYN